VGTANDAVGHVLRLRVAVVAPREGLAGSNYGRELEGQEDKILDTIIDKIR